MNFGKTEREQERGFLHGTGNKKNVEYHCKQKDTA